MILFWFCLSLALLLWVFYFLRFFWGVRYYLPSLIFLKEEENIPWRWWQKVIPLLLQTSFFLLFAVYFYGLRPQKGGIICIIDDFLRSQLTVPDFLNYQETYSQICQRQFFSLASLGEKNPQEILKNFDIWTNKPPSEEELFFWQKNYFKKKILLFTRKDNYLKVPNDDILYAQPVEPKKNFYFSSFKVEPDPTDYRKQNLLFSTQNGAKVFIERVSSRHILEIQKSEVQNYTLSIPSYSKSGLPFVEIIRLAIAQDDYSLDNEIYIPVYWQGPITIGSRTPPKTILAFSQMPEFPFFTFGPKGTKIYLEIKNCPDPQLGFLDVMGEVFQQIPIGKTCTLEEGLVLLRFSDGRAAVSKKNEWILFAFNPDKVNQNLLFHPEYPLLLWKTLYTSKSLDFVENRISEKLPLKVYVGKEILNKPSLTSPIEKVIAYNYSPESATVSGIEIPPEKIYYPEKSYVPSYLLPLALLLLCLIYLNPLVALKKFDI